MTFAPGSAAYRCFSISSSRAFKRRSPFRDPFSPSKECSRRAPSAREWICLSGTRFWRFINALGYVLFLTPEELSPALKWTSLHASEIRNFQDASPGDESLLSLVALWELSRRQGYRDADFLFAIDRRSTSAALCRHTDGLFICTGSKKPSSSPRGAYFRSDLPAVPRPELIDRLLEFVTWALRQSRDVRKRAVELLKIVLDFDFMTPMGGGLAQAGRDARGPAASDSCRFRPASISGIAARSIHTRIFALRHARRRLPAVCRACGLCRRSTKAPPPDAPFSRLGRSG